MPLPHTQHKWVETHEYAGAAPYAVRIPEWRCARCGCLVVSAEKPYRRRVMRRLGVGVDCRAELVRQVLEA